AARDPPRGRAELPPLREDAPVRHVTQPLPAVGPGELPGAPVAAERLRQGMVQAGEGIVVRARRLAAGGAEGLADARRAVPVPARADLVAGRGRRHGVPLPPAARRLAVRGEAGPL